MCKSLFNLLSRFVFIFKKDRSEPGEGQNARLLIKICLKVKILCEKLLCAAVLVAFRVRVQRLLSHLIFFVKIPYKILSHTLFKNACALRLRKHFSFTLATLFVFKLASLHDSDIILSTRGAFRKYKLLIFFLFLFFHDHRLLKMLLRFCVASLLMTVLSSDATKLFNFSCVLEKPPTGEYFIFFRCLS